MRISFILINLLWLASCATQVTSIKLDNNRVLESGRGFVLLGIQTNRNLKSILIDGPQNIELSSADIKQGTNYLLVDLEAGIYTVHKVRLDNYWRVDLDDEEYWTFEVMSDQISYVGHLEIVRRGYWSLITNTELVNRSSEALQFLEEKYPKLLASRNLTYGGPGNDNFFQYLAASKKE